MGRGSKPKAGLVGFATSHLNLAETPEPWELRIGKPGRIASAQDIMLEAPLGAAAFNNEFGRPCLAGYFRTFEAPSHRPGETWGYHKPVMLAGGVGAVAAEQVAPAQVPAGAKLVVLGGPAMLIGLGGGAASSMASGAADAELDFASVQRGNPEMQRRCQEVIDRCCALGEANPIRLIHDVGAGGLSNALPELLHEAGVGGRFDLRAVPNADLSMSPMEIWCNEAQERYVLAVGAEDLPVFAAICVRERCPHAVLGEADAERRLRVQDATPDAAAVDLPLSILFGRPPKTTRRISRRPRPARPFDPRRIGLDDAIERVLRFPAVASKKFLITIGDRSITGLVARDQMVGPRQVPVADAALTLAGFDTYRGEAMALGERSPIAVIDPAAAARMAVAEALANLAAAPIDGLSRVALSANWMAAAGHEGEDQALFEAVQAVGEGLCPALGIAIPVGKDSLSMRRLLGGRRRAVAGHPEHQRLRPRGGCAARSDAGHERQGALAARQRRGAQCSAGQPDRPAVAHRTAIQSAAAAGRQRSGAVLGRIGRSAAGCGSAGRLAGADRVQGRAGRPGLDHLLSRPLRWRPAGRSAGNGLRQRLRSGHLRAGGADRRTVR